MNVAVLESQCEDLKGVPYDGMVVLHDFWLLALAEAPCVSGACALTIVGSSAEPVFLQHRQDTQYVL